MIKYGSHIPLKKTITSTVQEYLDICENEIEVQPSCCQVFFGSPQDSSYKVKVFEEDDIKTCKKLLKKNKLNLYTHCAYNISLSNPNKPALNKLSQELITLHKLGGIGSVIHPGSSGYMNMQECGKKIANTVCKVYEDVFVENEGSINSCIILENCAGEGKKYMKDLEEIEEIKRNIEHYDNKYESNILERYFKICIDTCHLFACGDYDFRESGDIETFRGDFDDMIGLEYLQCFHLNDSMTDLGACKDRHENVGKGKLWKNSIEELNFFFRSFRNYDMIGEEDFKESKGKERLGTFKKLKELGEFDE